MAGPSTHVNIPNLTPTPTNNIARTLQAASAAGYEKRSKPADRLPTARLDDILPASSPYFELLRWEQQLDRHILAKQMRVADAAFKGPKAKRMLRVSVYNLAHDQPEGSNGGGVSKGTTNGGGPYAVFAFDNNDGDLLATASNSNAANNKLTPSWTLRIEGKLESRAGRPSTVAVKKLSSFLRSIIVQIGEEGGDVVEWRRSGPSSDVVDGFEIKRKGDRNVNVKILIELENQPERFKLSPELSSLLSNLQNSSKPHIIMALWRYVKLNKLQESDEKKVINCDKWLKDLFGVDKCTFSDLPALVSPHISPLDPVEIEYEVQVDKGPVAFCPYVYETEVEMDDPSRSNRTLISSPNLYNLQMDLDSATVRLRELTESLRATVHNRELLSEFAASPVEFIRKSYATQCEDISAILGDTKINIGDLFKADRFKSEDIVAAVSDMVHGIEEVSLTNLGVRQLIFFQSPISPHCQERIPEMLLNLSLVFAATVSVHAAYYPPDHTIPMTKEQMDEFGATLEPRQPNYGDEPMAPRIAWLEYLGHAYVEVYNYGRAQRCIDEIRRLSGISLADASLARLAIDGMARRMRGFKRSPPRRNLFKRIKSAIKGKKAKQVEKQHRIDAKRHSEYIQRLLAGDSGMWGVPQRPTTNIAPGYYNQGDPIRPGPAFGIETDQAAAMRRMIQCPNCPQYSDPFNLYGQPAQPLSNSYNHFTHMQPHPPPQPLTNSVYEDREGIKKSTDAIHNLLLEGRVQDADTLFAQMIQNSTSRDRPVYRIELVLSLIDLDLTEPNDCVPLWDAAWRLHWRDKLRIIDVYRSCRRAPYLHDALFASVRHLRFAPQIVARIKTILGAADAITEFSRVPSKSDFYACGVCWARKRMGQDGYRRMQRLLVRAEHDADLTPAYRRYFGQMLQHSFRPERFDPRVHYFQTVFPQDLAFSMITGEYSGLYDFDREQGLPSPYSSFFGRSHSASGRYRNGPVYRALKNPNPVPRDRQDVLLDAFADGSPEQLALLMNEHRHSLVKEIMTVNPAVSIEGLLRDIEALKREMHTAEGEEKKMHKLAKERHKQWEKAIKEGQVSEEQIEQYERVQQEQEELMQRRNRILSRLQSLLAVARQSEGYIQGADQMGMQFHDFGSQPLSKRHHDKILGKMGRARDEVGRLYKKALRHGHPDGGENYDAGHHERQAYLDDMEESRRSMQQIEDQLTMVERQLQGEREQE